VDKKVEILVFLIVKRGSNELIRWVKNIEGVKRLKRFLKCYRGKFGQYVGL